jgi:LacI family transcriptional regulator
MATTIRDVARAAGVSASTVSRALSNPEMVSDSTRELVQRTAQRLGYRPNPAARRLITGRTQNIGIVLPDLGNPVFPSIVKGIQSRARENGYCVLLSDSDEDPSGEPALVRTLASQVDGVVLCSPRMSTEELRSMAGLLPLVVVQRTVDQIPAVVFDNASGVQQAVSHLHALGHRRIAWGGGPERSYSQERRTRGIREATAQLGMELLEAGHFAPRFSSGLMVADLVLSGEATGVVAYNDLMALGILHRLHARGVAVPGEISVIGHDDIPFAGMVHPALTTVALSTERAGRAAVDLLVSLLESPDQMPRLHRTLPCDLQIRASTGLCRCVPGPARGTGAIHEATDPA